MTNEELQSPEETPELEPAGAEESAAAGQEEFGLSMFITAELMNKYISEAVELTNRAEQVCLELEGTPDNADLVDEFFGVVHSLKGNSGFMGLADIEAMSIDVENILELLRSKTLDITSELVSTLLAHLDDIKRAIIALDTTASERFARKRPARASEPQTPATSAPAAAANANEPEVASEALERSQTVAQNAAAAADADADAEQTRSQQAASIAASASALAKKDIRVDTNKLDKLFDLVGELIIIETMVTANPDLAGMELPSFQRAANMLNKITRELQEVTMSIRMTPLEGLFGKMKRLVRDLSVKFNKKINLEIAGQETEMDKNVIEELSDPLMHIIRNALDHGIEPAEERLKAGKSDVGRVRLNAYYEGNEILITVEDDGGGLNRQHIIRKAIERGLLKTDPDKLNDNEVWAFIFEPGFSTAAQVSEISGRGVGMDVVKKNIEKLQGSIRLASHQGLGTRFTLRIPLTLAIMDGMLVRVGAATYAIPTLSIREAFRPHSETVTKTMDGLELARVRNEMLSIVRLHEAFNKTPDTYDLEQGILVVVESGGRQTCLFADEIIGQQQIVVKNLSDYIGYVKGITGCMILASGEIGLILDIETLVSMSEGTLAE